MDPLLLWGLILLGSAFVIGAIDLFVPTAGVLIVTALAVALAGIVLLFRYDTGWGAAGLGAVVVGGPAMVALGFRIFPHTPIGRKLILGGDRDEDEAPAPEAVDPLAKLVGSEAMVVSDLRPVGVVRIGTQKFDALSETTLVRAGQSVRVTGYEAGTLKVRPV